VKHLDKNVFFVVVFLNELYLYVCRIYLLSTVIIFLFCKKINFWH